MTQKYIFEGRNKSQNIENVIIKYRRVLSSMCWNVKAFDPIDPMN